MTQHSNQKSKTPKGKPSGGERGSNGLKDVNLSEAEDQAIEDKYLDDQEQPAEQVQVRHKNRNTDKGREDQGKDTSSI
jgi:hypothetical protein